MCMCVCVCVCVCVCESLSLCKIKSTVSHLLDALVADRALQILNPSNPAVSFLLHQFVGLAAGAAAYPFDTVRRRLIIQVRVCVCVCARARACACVRACVRACVHVCANPKPQILTPNCKP